MAWVENQTWEMEQGIDAQLILRLYSDEAGTVPWQFPNYDVNGVIRNRVGTIVSPLIVSTTPSQGEIKLILSESVVNTLNPSELYTYECLLVAPGSTTADDYFVAVGPATVALRTTRRDP